LAIQQELTGFHTKVTRQTKSDVSLHGINFGDTQDASALYITKTPTVLSGAETNIAFNIRMDKQLTLQIVEMALTTMNLQPTPTITV